MRITMLLLLALGLVTFANGAQNIVLWSGGISQEERALAPASGTKLVFFVSSGSYLSEIAVEVSNSNGDEIVNTRTTGPWLILDLAAGDYTVTATRRNGDIQSSTISVLPDSNQEFGFMFPGA